VNCRLEHSPVGDLVFLPSLKEYLLTTQTRYAAPNQHFSNTIYQFKSLCKHGCFGSGLPTAIGNRHDAPASSDVGVRHASSVSEQASHAIRERQLPKKAFDTWFAEWVGTSSDVSGRFRSHSIACLYVHPKPQPGGSLGAVWILSNKLGTVGSHPADLGPAEPSQCGSSSVFCQCFHDKSAKFCGPPAADSHKLEGRLIPARTWRPDASHSAYVLTLIKH